MKGELYHMYLFKYIGNHGSTLTIVRDDSRYRSMYQKDQIVASTTDVDALVQFKKHYEKKLRTEPSTVQSMRFLWNVFNATV